MPFLKGFSGYRSKDAGIGGRGRRKKSCTMKRGIVSPIGAIGNAGIGGVEFPRLEAVAFKAVSYGGCERWNSIAGYRSHRVERSGMPPNAPSRLFSTLSSRACERAQGSDQGFFDHLVSLDRRCLVRLDGIGPGRVRSQGYQVHKPCAFHRYPICPRGFPFKIGIPCLRFPLPRFRLSWHRKKGIEKGIASMAFVGRRSLHEISFTPITEHPDDQGSIQEGRRQPQ